MKETFVDVALHEEIHAAQTELRVAEAQFAEASGLYIDSAVMKLNACKTRLNCLYAEARGRGAFHYDSCYQQTIS